MKQHLRHRTHAAMTGLRVEILSLALPFAAHSEDGGRNNPLSRLPAVALNWCSPVLKSLSFPVYGAGYPGRRRTL